MTISYGKQTQTLAVPDDLTSIKKFATVVIHGGYIDRVLGPHLDKRIPHKDLPKLDCPIVDTTTIDEAHDEKMFTIVSALVDHALTIDVKRLIQELKALGATVTGGEPA